MRWSEAWVARFFRERIKESKRPIQSASFKPRPESWSNDRITLTWLGHATVLINFQGLTILTDPVFTGRIGLNLGLGVLGPKRFIAAALQARELPPVDVLILSHAHMDHLDLPSLRALCKPGFAVTARATGDLLESTPAAGATELRWGERVVHRCAKGELEIEAFEVDHWGARWRRDRHRGYNGYILRRGGKSLIFGGDTAMTPLFARLRSRGPFELAIMPIAAYRPWIRYHCTPEEAVRMTDAAGGRFILPIHHSTFRLSEEPMTEPMERLETALKQERDRIALRRVGETFVVPA